MADDTTGTAPTAKGPKPKLRGVSHEIFFYVSLVAGAFLVATTADRVRLSVLVYGLSVSAMFGISALYHRPTWTPEKRRWMRRADHAGIFLLIAGTYTPFTLVLGPADATQMLAVAWIGAGLGVLQSLFWVHAPKVISAGLYVALGWACVPFVPALRAGIGDTSLALLLGGGVLYSLGAVTYALRRPRLVPHVFGYHEVFHALVVVAAVLHFVAVRRTISSLG